MGYKITNSSSSFVDITLSETLKHNRSLQNMDKLNKSIDWEKIKSILSCHYIHGTSNEGASAYHPILLYKCLLLQKWFRIQSDPELESQINDRLSFKKFLGLPFEAPSPDHSTFSRFRARLSKETMDQINSEILRQFEKQVNDNASRARFTTIAKNKFDLWMRQAAYNILKGVRILSKSSF